MAELILTDKEKTSDVLSLWSDAALGKAVRLCISILIHNEKESVFAVACGQILCAIAAKTNATELKMKLGGVTDGDRELGDWRILVEKIA